MLLQEEQVDFMFSVAPQKVRERRQSPFELCFRSKKQLEKALPAPQA